MALGAEDGESWQVTVGQVFTRAYKTLSSHIRLDKAVSLYKAV